MSGIGPVVFQPGCQQRSLGSRHRQRVEAVECCCIRKFRLRCEEAQSQLLHRSHLGLMREVVIDSDDDRDGEKGAGTFLPRFHTR